MEWIILILVGVGLFAVVRGPFRSSLRILPAPTWCVGVALTIITTAGLPLWADLCTLWLVLLIGGRWHQARMRRERKRSQIQMLDLIEHVSQTGASPERTKAAAD